MHGYIDLVGDAAVDGTNDDVTIYDGGAAVVSGLVAIISEINVGGGFEPI